MLTESEQETACADTLKTLKDWKFSFSAARWEEDWFEREFELSLKSLDIKSTVGMTSLRHYGNTIEALLGGSPAAGDADPERVLLLKQAVAARLSAPEDPDPIRVFVKHEPHKELKLQEGRYRLISAVSVVDTMCDRIMLGWLQRRALETVGRTPVALGWSPVGGGAEWLVDLFAGRDTRALDMTAWDWRIPGWLLRLMLQIIQELALGAPDFWRTWIEARWRSLFRDAVFCFKDGTVVQQPGWGVMKSGCFMTILLNSLGQVVRHNIVARRLALPSLDYVVIGDDQTIENFPEFDKYEAMTRELGFLLKESEISTGMVRFAGYEFAPDYRFWPEYAKKHVFKVTHTSQDKLPDVLDSYQLLYAFVPRWRDWIREELARRSPDLVLPVWHLQRTLRGL